MDTLIHADIFFFITAIAVVVLSLTLLVALVYLTAILRDVKHITERARTEADLIAADIGELRRDQRKEGFPLTKVFGFVRGLFTRHHTPRKRGGPKRG
jgi:hypothetical protein